MSAADPTTTATPTTDDSIGKAFTDTFTDAFKQVVDLAPRIVGMLLVLVVGYLIARLAARAVAILCEKIGLQTAAERSGLAQSMQQVGIKRNDRRMGAGLRNQWKAVRSIVIWNGSLREFS